VPAVGEKRQQVGTDAVGDKQAHGQRRGTCLAAQYRQRRHTHQRHRKEHQERNTRSDGQVTALDLLHQRHHVLVGALDTEQHTERADEYFAGQE
jgi:hypothetical protein